MKFIRILLALSFFAIFIVPAQAQKEEWLPITPEDLQIQQVPNDPGAPAIQLYYANYIKGSRYYEFVYHRIKILTEAGRKYANVEIIGHIGVDIGNLKARTIHPDGSIVEFTGKPFNKTIFKGRGIKWNAKAFTMPEVTIGSIIEYRYRLNNYSSLHWVLQHDLYTVHEYCNFEPSRFAQAFSWTGRNVNGVPPVSKADIWEIDWKDVPAFQSEPDMPPQEDFKPTVDFYYLRRGVNGAGQYWQDTANILNTVLKKYIGNRKEVKEAALQAIGNETDHEKGLHRLYDRAQQIRNLSYERARTRQERKEENLKENGDLAEIVKRGYGESTEVTSLFVGMARAAGFDAEIVWASSRRNVSFSRNLPSLSSLDAWVALVNLNGKEIFLQPGVRFCPYGLMRWENTSTDALRIERESGSFIRIPAQDNLQSLTHRTASMVLAEDGTLKGEVTVEFKGQEALEHRLEALDTDEAGKKKDLEEEIKSWLPGESTAQIVDTQGWEGPDVPLVAKFKVEVPGYASFVGKRLLMSPLLFQSQPKEAFTHADRKYPVYYPYAFTEHDRIVIQLPAGYSPESIPARQDIGIGYARYQSFSTSNGKQLVSERAFGFAAMYVGLDHYAELKNFMSKIMAGDGEQLVLRAEIASDPQKPN